MGRPTKFNADRGAVVCERLRQGATRKAAAAASGVCYTTLLAWLEKGEGAASGAFRDFHDALTRGEAEAELRHTAVIEKAADGWECETRERTVKTVIRMRKTHHPDGTVVEEPVGVDEVSETVTVERRFDWRASLEWLRRRRSENWTEKVRSEITGADGAPVGVHLTGISFEDALKALREDPDTESYPE